jgi:transposase InsO family protein
MRDEGLAGLPARKRFRRPIERISPTDLVERNFIREQPDQLWVTDITEYLTRPGKLYCAVLLDAFSRRVLGWSIDAALVVVHERSDLEVLLARVEIRTCDAGPAPGSASRSDNRTELGGPEC